MSDMSSGLLRQRRNLMGMSAFLPLYLISGISLYEVSFLGNKVEIKNPQVITYSLVAMSIYFLLRYYLYFKEEIELK